MVEGAYNSVTYRGLPSARLRTPSVLSKRTLYGQASQEHVGLRALWSGYRRLISQATSQQRTLSTGWRPTTTAPTCVRNGYAVWMTSDGIEALDTFPAAGGHDTFRALLIDEEIWTRPTRCGGRLVSSVSLHEHICTRKAEKVLSPLMRLVGLHEHTGSRNPGKNAAST